MEQNLVTVPGFGIQRQHNIKVIFCQRIGVHIHIDVDSWSLVSRLQRTWRTRIFKRQVFDILGQNIERRAWLWFCRAIAVFVFVRHRIFLLGKIW